MSTKAVKSILETRLSVWAASRADPLRIAYENVSFTPISGETYLRCFLLPAQTTSADLAGQHRAYIGVFQVSIVRPSNAGAGPMYDIQAELAQLFALYDSYNNGLISVQVTSPVSAATGIQEDTYFVVPCSLTYRADVI